MPSFLGVCDALFCFVLFCSFFREELSELESFPERELASLVLSKVYYHLGSFNDSLTYALAAGHRFDVNGTSEYIETMLCEFILTIIIRSSMVLLEFLRALFRGGWMGELLPLPRL